MELQEAINHAREVAEGCAAGDRDCAYQHDKLVDWLEELKVVKNILGDDYDPDRLCELVEADRDGRCVVLPCKLGDPIYRLVSGYVFIGKFFIEDAPKMGKTVFPTYEAAEAALKGDGS